MDVVENNAGLIDTLDDWRDWLPNPGLRIGQQLNLTSGKTLSSGATGTAVGMTAKIAKKQLKVATRGQLPTAEVPRGSRVSFTATFVQQGIVSTLIGPWEIGRQIYARSRVASSRDKIRDALENTKRFVDVTPTQSLGQGAVSITFKTSGEWPTLSELREYVKKSVTAAVGVTPGSVTAKVYELGTVGKTTGIKNTVDGSQVRNNASDHNQKVAEKIAETSGNAVGNLTGGAGAMLNLLPIALLGGVIVLAVALKK
jgi:phage tail sheath gpL-like